MTFFEYLSILRRRSLYLIVGCLVGVIAGFATAPGGAAGDGSLRSGVHTLLVDEDAPGGAAINLDQAALLAETGPVPGRVARRLVDEGLPAPVRLEAVADIELRSLEVIATSETDESAAKAADYAAEEISKELVAADTLIYEDQLASRQGLVDDLRTSLQAIDAQIAPLPPDAIALPSLRDQRSSIAASLSTVQNELSALENQGAPTPPLRTLEKATGGPAVEQGWRLPETRPARAAMLGLLGLVLGGLGALAAERLDTRVRGKDDAERAFDLPVIAEIPPMPTGSKRGDLVVVTKPAAPFVESFRALRTVVLFAAAERAAAEANGNGSHGAHRAEVVLITSPSAGEGKTTTAAHLAAVLAETDQRVLILSADFRRPRIHEYFDLPREPGLSDVLETGLGRAKLSDLQMATSFPGVHLMPSGAPVENPAQLLNECAHLLGAARQLFDFIIVDTPPLLVANDATELATEADMVILVAKADRTSRAGARRTTEILRRVDAPLLGAAVVAAHDTPTAYGYYRYRYYSYTDQGRVGRRLRARSKKKDEPTTDEATVEQPEPVAVAAGPDPIDDVPEG